MRKTLLFIKVILLLAAFVGTSSGHASKSESQSFIAVSVFDVGINNACQQNTAEDDKAIITDVEVSPVVFNSTPVSWQLSMLIESVGTIHFARAPPVNTLT